MSSTMQTLVESLALRWTPEQVIKVMFESKDADFDPGERVRLSSALPRHSYSTMPTSFSKAAGLDRQLKVAADLFPSIPVPAERTPDALAEYLATMRASMHMDGGSDFKSQRLTHAERKTSRGRKGQPKMVPNGHRAYNKRFRFIARMEKHIGSRSATAEMRELAQIAKSRLAFKLDRKMLTNLKTACFVAYMTAKLNKRSIFTFDSQENPYDTIADMLFKRLGRGTNWLAVAYVHPEPEVLKYLDEQEKGTLLGVWFSVMTRAVKVLGREASGVDLKSFIVRRGNDSSTWNEAAGAYNKARDGWMNTLYALGMEDALENFAPGKALRLMAADVAYGHQMYGKGLDPATAVFGELPKPWDVILHGESCTRAMVEKACNKHNVKSGWLAPKKKSVAAYTPTPELVHGVIVSSPDLAAALRASGYFAGPSKKAPSGFVNVAKKMIGLTVYVDSEYATDEDVMRRAGLQRK